MIPSITSNRSASWEKHVHSLFGLRASDFPPGGEGVSLDDSPFILDDGAAPPSGAGAPDGGWAGAAHGGGGPEGGAGGGGGGYGVGFDASRRGEPRWWFRRADAATGPLLLDAQDNATSWINETAWALGADDGHHHHHHHHPPTPAAAAAASASAAPPPPSPSFNASLACRNASANASECALGDPVPLVVTPEGLALCLLLLFFAVSTVFGNGLVIVAVARERYLHTVTNYFIMSLAVADCLVGALVMPFSALYDSFDRWPFGPDFCDVWRSFDVLASTASILNLCVISLDRYWAITDPFSYPSRMSPRRARLLIALVWVCSALISFPAIAWWRAVSDPHPAGSCPFTEDLSYLVFSSTISFYGPLLVMVFTYFRIYRAATEQTRSLKLGQKLVSAMGEGEVELTLRIHRGGRGAAGRNGGLHRPGNGPQENGEGHHRHGVVVVPQQPRPPPQAASLDEDGESCPLGPVHDDDDDGGGGVVACSSSSPDSSAKMVSRNLKTFSISRKLCKFAKEKKAAKTLGIVMGVFIVCWLPFFVTNLLSGLCGEECIREPALVDGVVTWLGWINSAMNPVIYACWAKDFRRAFTRILCSCCPRRCRKRYQTRWKGGIAQVRFVLELASESLKRRGEMAYKVGEETDGEDTSLPGLQEGEESAKGGI